MNLPKGGEPIRPKPGFSPVPQVSIFPEPAQNTEGSKIFANFAKSTESTMKQPKKKYSALAPEQMAEQYQLNLGATDLLFPINDSPRRRTGASKEPKNAETSPQAAEKAGEEDAGKEEKDYFIGINLLPVDASAAQSDRNSRSPKKGPKLQLKLPAGEQVPAYNSQTNEFELFSPYQKRSDPAGDGALSFDLGKRNAEEKGGFFRQSSLHPNVPKSTFADAFDPAQFKKFNEPQIIIEPPEQGPTPAEQRTPPPASKQDTLKSQEPTLLIDRIRAKLEKDVSEQQENAPALSFDFTTAAQVQAFLGDAAGQPKVLCLASDKFVPSFTFLQILRHHCAEARLDLKLADFDAPEIQLLYADCEVPCTFVPSKHLTFVGSNFKQLRELLQ